MKTCSEIVVPIQHYIHCLFSTLDGDISCYCNKISNLYFCYPQQYRCFNQFISKPSFGSKQACCLIVFEIFTINFILRTIHTRSYHAWNVNTIHHSFKELKMNAGEKHSTKIIAAYYSRVFFHALDVPKNFLIELKNGMD